MELKNLKRENPSLTERIKQVLIEHRMVLPGAQALLGFQLIIIWQPSFDRLPQFLKLLHLSSLACLAISTVLLMTPAAYHRIVEQGEESEHFHGFSSRLLLVAMAWLGLGLAIDLEVVVQKILGSWQIGLAAALIALLFFYSIWFAFTAYRRREEAAFFRTANLRKSA